MWSIGGVENPRTLPVDRAQAFSSASMANAIRTKWDRLWARIFFMTQARRNSTVLGLMLSLSAITLFE